MKKALTYLAFFALGCLIAAPVIIAAKPYAYTHWRMAVRDHMQVGDISTREARFKVKAASASEDAIVVEGASATTNVFSVSPAGNVAYSGTLTGSGVSGFAGITNTGVYTQSGTSANTFTGPISTSDGTTLGAELEVTGAVDANSTSNFQGAMVLQAGLSVGTTLAVTGVSTMTGELNADGTLDANSDADFANRVLVNGGFRPALKTADPCADSGEFPIGTIFYNSTSNYMCFCGASNADLKMNDNSTACF